MRKIADIFNLVDTRENGADFRRDIMIFLSEILEKSVSEIKYLSDQLVSEAEYQKILSGIDRIISGEPVYRVLGYRYFWKDRFHLSKDTLEPRSDTEVLIETCLSYEKATSHKLSILDVGTGTGCLLLSLLREYSNSSGMGVDISRGALDTASLNSEVLGFSDRAQWVESNWLDNVEGKFDIVVSNPPYISTSDISDLSEVVRQHDPMRALDGGNDGLGPYRVLAEQLKKVVHKSTLILLEIGYDQSESVPSIFKAVGYNVIEVVNDYGKNPRCVVMRPDSVL